MYDCIIIGAGPAGLMSAIAIDKNKKVLLIEKNPSAGVKLLITGGGRCKVTNLKSNNDFLNEVNYNKKFLYSAINKFGPNDIYNFFESKNVPLKIEEEDKVFPKSNKANDILRVLLDEVNHIDIKYNENVLEIINNEIKEVITNKTTYKTKNVIIATGGSSFKHTGSNGDNLKFAKKLNQPVVPLFPAETSIKLVEHNDLAGTSLDEVIIIFENKKTSGNLMFTHTGLSGTSIMKMSEFIYKSNNKELKIDLLPNLTPDEILTIINNYDREKELSSLLNEYFTKRLSSYLVDRLNLNKKIKSLIKIDIDTIISNLKGLTFKIKEVNDLDLAYVTGGGIDLASINSTTMESKINPGIYFVGEALDIHGPIGGYNITLALSTGHLAGESINKEKK